jgi:hypothetical protein
MLPLMAGGAGHAREKPTIDPHAVTLKPDAISPMISISAQFLEKKIFRKRVAHGQRTSRDS